MAAVTAGATYKLHDLRNDDEPSKPMATIRDIGYDEKRAERTPSTEKRDMLDREKGVDVVLVDGTDEIRESGALKHVTMHIFVQD